MRTDEWGLGMRAIGLLALLLLCAAAMASSKARSDDRTGDAIERVQALNREAARLNRDGKYREGLSVAQRALELSECCLPNILRSLRA